MKKSPSARAQSLYSVAKGLEAKRRDVAASVHIQTGLSVVEAEKEVELSITRLSDWAAYCDKIQGGSLVRTFILCKSDKRNFTNKQMRCYMLVACANLQNAFTSCRISLPSLCHSLVALSLSLKPWES